MKTKIVLFEDDKNVKELVNEILISSGYEVVILDPESNTDFISVLADAKPDLIISDIMMPGKDGIEIFKELNNSPELSDTPFIFLTAKSDYSDIRTGMSLGADDYILKPFKAKDLLRSVELRLNKSKRVKERLNVFSSGIALHIPHELRTPLISLLGYSDIILEDYDSLSDKDIREYTGNIKKSSQRLHKTIEKFILYSEILSSEIKGRVDGRFIGKTSTDISALINFYSLSSAASANRQQDLIISLDDYESNITEESISIVITQLMDNAFKFSDAGTKVKITGKKEDSGYLVTIEDNGIGMSEKEIANIFPLQQFSKNYYTQGNGLGLAIVEKILNYLNTKLEINSVPEIGTKVSFRI